MKKKVFSAMVTCGLFILGAAANSYAQMPGSEVRTTIPFEFKVNGKTLAPGKYDIKRVNDSPETLLISNEGKGYLHDRAMFNTEPRQARKAPGKGEIVFHRYGDTYFLSEILIAGEQTARELPQTRQERWLRRELLSNGKQSEPETVALLVD